MQSDPGAVEVTDVDPTIDFSAAEIRASLQHLNTGKAPGPDCISAEMLKYANEIVLETYVDLFSGYLRQGIFPL